MNHLFRALRATLPLAALPVLLVACGQPPHGPTSGAPATPEVGYVVVKPEHLALTTELPGRTAPYLIAEIRPQVTGLVKARLFREGSDVKAGQVLYRIDEATYRASFDSATAALAKAQANLRSSRLKAQRYQELVGLKAVSQQDADDAAASADEAEADVAAARATLETSRINLAFTQLAAPIAGRIGKSSFTTGALVTADQASALATVQQLDPIYVDVTQSSTTLLRLRRGLGRGKLEQPASGADSVADSGAVSGVPSGTSPAAISAAGGATEVHLILEDGSRYPLTGRLEFSDVTVDQNTGAFTVRAVFPNPKNELLPGMFVRAEVEEGVREQALLVPQAAVRRDGQGKPFVFVIDAAGKLEERAIETERALGNRWLIASGLAAGERVAVDGQDKAHAGGAVKAILIDYRDAPATGAPSTGAPSTDRAPTGARRTVASN
jgi:membrane fusion protein (multidrug efflux system)